MKVYSHYSLPGVLTLLLAGLILLAVLPPLVERGLRRAGHVEPNFRGERIPQSFGLTILLWAGVMLSATAFVFSDLRPTLLLWLLAVAGFGTLGLVDDVWGTKRIKGLRGHFRAAFRERTLTTGFVKAAGGLALAIYLGYGIALLPPFMGARGSASVQPAAPFVGGVVLNALLIALCANAVNLLDLRPGRAGGAFLLGAVPLCALLCITGAASALPLALVIIITVVVWRQDARARVMMGDAGSNLLGAALGLALCSEPIGLPARALALVLLVALHILAERVSLTRLIARNRILSALDALSGIR